MKNNTVNIERKVLITGVVLSLVLSMLTYIALTSFTGTAGGPPENVALNKPVYIDNRADNARNFTRLTNGIPGHEGAWPLQISVNQYFIVDLESRYTVNAVSLYLVPVGGAAYEISYSADGVKFKPLIRYQDGSKNPEEPVEYTHDFPAVTARYIKVTAADAGSLSISEIEIYSSDGELPPEQSIAFGYERQNKPVSDDLLEPEKYYINPVKAPEGVPFEALLTDGKKGGTVFNGAAECYDRSDWISIAEFVFRLKEPSTVSRIMFWGDIYSDRTLKAEISVSDDGIHYVPVNDFGMTGIPSATEYLLPLQTNFKLQKGGTDSPAVLWLMVFDAIEAEYVKIRASSDGYGTPLAYSEIEIFETQDQDRVLEGLEVKTNTDFIKDYTYPDLDFNHTGLEVKAVYEDGSKRTLASNKYTVSPGTLTYETAQIRISYSEGTGEEKITVHEDISGFTVNKAIPQTPGAQTVVYKEGLTLGSVILPDGWKWDEPLTEFPELEEGEEAEYFYDAFVDETANYKNKSDCVRVIVVTGKYLPQITNPKYSDIAYGQTVNEAEKTRNGSAIYEDEPVKGSFIWVDGENIFAVGKHFAYMRFIPEDNDTYSSVLFQIQITVYKATPVISAKPSARKIIYSQSLGESLLTSGAAKDAEGNSIPGGFNWETPQKVLNAGTHSNIKAVFIPSDSINYNTVSCEITITVDQMTPNNITPPSASNIKYGQTLESSVLSGGSTSASGSSLDGSFYWTDDTVLLNAGSHTASVTFKPVLGNYKTVTCNVSLTVEKADPDPVMPKTYSVGYKTGLKLKDIPPPDDESGTWSWETNGETGLKAGSALECKITYTPADTKNYNTLKNRSLTLKVEEMSDNADSDEEEYYSNYKDAFTSTGDLGITGLAAVFMMALFTVIFIRKRSF